MQSFISRRTFQVRVGTELSPTCCVENGIIQGSELSPLLFMLMINDHSDNIGISKALFADDCVAWETGLLVENTVKSVQNTLDITEEWCGQVGVSSVANQVRSNSILEKKETTGNSTTD